MPHTNMLWITKNSCLRATWRTIPKESLRAHRLQQRCFGRNFSQSSVDKSFAEDLRYPPLLKPFLVRYPILAVACLSNF